MPLKAHDRSSDWDELLAGIEDPMERARLSWIPKLSAMAEASVGKEPAMELSPEERRAAHQARKRLYREAQAAARKAMEG